MRKKTKMRQRLFIFDHYPCVETFQVCKQDSRRSELLMKMGYQGKAREGKQNVVDKFR
jgi:hypothetical protein